MNDPEIAALKVEVRYLKEAQQETKVELANLRKEIRDLTTFITEAKFGRRFMIGAITAAALLGGMIDTICRALKLY